MNILGGNDMKSSRNILWISRHPMTEAQQDALMGKHTKQIWFRQIHQAVENVDDLEDDVAMADVICVVLPPRLMTEFMAKYKNWGKPILRAISKRRELDGTATFEFIKWQRVLDFVEIVEDWDPEFDT
jgi:hypothetical protein